MINKKNLLGKAPHELGDKDAIHVAIVAVRAGIVITPGYEFYNEGSACCPEYEYPDGNIFKV